MKINSKISLFIILFFSFIFSTASWGTQVLTIAKPEQDYPPYHWIEDGKVVGLLPEILAEVAILAEINDIEYTYVPWNRMLQLALSGGVDAVFPIMMTKERAEFIDYVDEPLIDELYGFYALNTKATSIKNADDLSNLTVGIVSGYQYTNDINSLNLVMVQAANEVVQVKMLIAERVDVILMDQHVVRYYQTLKHENDYKQLRLLPIKIAKNPLYLGFSKARNLHDQVSKMTQALRKLKSKGKYQKLVNKYAQFSHPIK